MGKFLAIGRHGPIDPSEGRKHAELALGWIPERLADGSLDCVYSMAGGGRMVIANADTADEVLALLEAAPDAKRDWQITELYDGEQVLRDYLASTS
jgi:hypothetical protein